MAPRSSWKGFLRLSLVSVPVQAFTAAESGDGDVHLHQLHESCHSRIRYAKMCPIHGEVPNSEIVRGYEYAKGEHVIVDDKEIEKLRLARDRTISLDTFVTPDEIDPMYFNGRTYYLAPDGAAGEKPYSVLLRALQQEQRWGIGQAVMFGRQELVLVRSFEHVLGLQMLHYESQLRAETVLTDEVSLTEVSKQELKLATTLIEASTQDKFDLGAYHDQYARGMKDLIEAKIEGKEIVTAPQEEEAPVINLMDALRKSVEQAKGGGKKRAASGPRAKSAKRKKSSRRTA